MHVVCARSMAIRHATAGWDLPCGQRAHRPRTPDRALVSQSCTPPIRQRTRCRAQLNLSTSSYRYLHTSLVHTVWRSGGLSRTCGRTPPVRSCTYCNRPLRSPWCVFLHPKKMLVRILAPLLQALRTHSENSPLLYMFARHGAPRLRRSFLLLLLLLPACGEICCGVLN